MTAAHVDRIVRYPVKGLAGVVADEPVHVHPGRGLRWDRSHAIENGVVAPRSRAGWNPRETYFHVAKHEAIVRIGVTLDEAEGDVPLLTLTAPDGRSARVRLGAGEHDATSPATFGGGRAADDVDALLDATLPSGPLGAPALVHTGAGLWDWPEAHLSIINLATVDALADAADTPIDRRRFRGNLYLGGLEAWSELALLGRRIRVGTAVLEVFQPTDRCRATTINPADAVSDLNVPALLASRFGHMYCGVYARVVVAGDVPPGAPIEVLDEPAAPIEGERGWPRSGVVLERREESARTTSFWISDPLGFAPAARPGQHVRVHLPGAAAPSWRCYTISATEPGRLRISVKRDGRVSSMLHDEFSPGTELVITGPFGEVTIDPDASGDVLLVSAGAGITPTVAMLRALDGSARRIRVLHVERSAAELSLWHEVRDACAALPDAEAQLFLTRETPTAAASVDATAGRPATDSFAAVLAELDLDTVSAYVCGPAEFTAELRERLAGLGLHPERLSTEVFFSPTTAELSTPREPSTTGPHTITAGDDELEWRPAAGSVLDAVEGIGLDWPSGCRVGACGTCARVLRSGTVEYLSEPLVPPPAGSVLVCCTAPTSDLVFDAVV